MNLSEQELFNQDLTALVKLHQQIVEITREAFLPGNALLMLTRHQLEKKFQTAVKNLRTWGEPA